MRGMSLQGVPERLAVKGEVLITYRFRTGSIGLVSPVEFAAARGSAWKRLIHRFLRTDATAAVRVSPGTRLKIHSVPDEMSWEFGVGAIEDVTFVELSAEACRHRHAIRFRNGRHALLQMFGEGVSLQVLADGSNGRKPDHEPQEPFRIPQPETDLWGWVPLSR
jgi:hypothetical protein